MSHNTIHLASQLLAWLIPALWLLRVADAARGIPTLANLNLPAHDVTPAGNPTLTVIVPARNEAENVAACLASLLAQDYPHLRIVAVDDRSTDFTGLIMDQYTGPNLTKLEVASLPQGWLGKTHAMASAADQAIADHHPDYLLFTDADVLFRSDALRRALAAAVAMRADHFVLGPTTIIRRWDEAALLSFFQIFGLWVARPWKVADPHARDAIGIGAFNLVRRQAYQQIGGFAAMRMEIVEDIALARRIKAYGLRQRFAYGRNLVRVHWAAGVPGLVDVMTKNTFAATNYHPSLILLGCVWLYFFCVGPFVVLPFHPSDLPAWLTVAAIACTYALIGRLSSHSFWNFLLAPFAGAIFIFTLLRSMLTTLRQGGVIWRGTFYPLAELRKNAAPLNQRRRR